jgi:folate-dependent phosphoribosylglycinamide formyltransferase PurN
MLNLAIFGSGSGSNYQAIAEAIAAGTLDARIACVISDVEDAFILERARKLGHPAIYLEAGAKETGCTVHFVDTGIDTGPIIVQRKVAVLPDDTVETLMNRIHAQEHIAYPEALRKIANGLAR